MKHAINRALSRLKPTPSKSCPDSLIVTTSTAVMRLNAAHISDNPSADIIHSGHGLYYGLVAAAHHVWVAARGSMVSDSRASSEEAGTVINLCDPSLRADTESLRPLRDLHGMAHARDALWVASSYDDAVGIYSLGSSRWTWWQPLPIDPVAGPDQFHFNTLVIEGELVWVLAHRRGPSWLLAFPIDAAMKGETVDPLRKIELGQQAHNMWRQPDGELCTCSSIEGMLLGEHGWRLETGGFPRGVAKISDGWVVGISELKERKARDFSDARLRFYDSNWETTGEFTLPGVGMVLDILPIPPSLSLPVVGTQPLFVS